MIRTIARSINRNARLQKRAASSHSGSSSAEIVEEDFASPIWRNTAALGLASFLLYKADELYAARNGGQGYFARLMDYYRPPDGLWEDRNVRHYDLGLEAAHDRLLLQSAQKPHTRQLRYPAALDHGSPFNARADARFDTSKIVVKNRQGVPLAGQEFADMPVKESIFHKVR